MYTVYINLYEMISHSWLWEAFLKCKAWWRTLPQGFCLWAWLGCLPYGAATVVNNSSASIKSPLLSAACGHFKMIWGFASEEDILCRVEKIIIGAWTRDLSVPVPQHHYYGEHFQFSVDTHVVTRWFMDRFDLRLIKNWNRKIRPFCLVYIIGHVSMKTKTASINGARGVR